MTKQRRIRRLPIYDEAAGIARQWRLLVPSECPLLFVGDVPGELMKRSRFSEERLIWILKEHQAGLGASELCCKRGIIIATLYQWRFKYCVMEVSDAQRLETLEPENAKLNEHRLVPVGSAI